MVNFVTIRDVVRTGITTGITTIAATKVIAGKLLVLYKSDTKL